MKKAAHREHWDFQATKLLMAEKNIYEELRRQAWSRSLSIGSHVYAHGSFVETALKMLGESCDERCARYLLRAVKRSTTKPADRMFDLSYIGAKQMSYWSGQHHNRLWRECKRHAQYAKIMTVDWAKLEARIAAERGDKLDAGAYSVHKASGEK